MTRNHVIEILKYANRWRRGEEIKMPDPIELGKAIDRAVELLDKQKPDTSTK